MVFFIDIAAHPALPMLADIAKKPVIQMESIQRIRVQIANVQVGATAVIIPKTLRQ